MTFGDLLSTPAPKADDAEIAALLLRHYGLSGGLRRLTSERDLNLHLCSDDRQFVVKFANPAEPRDVTAFQTAGLLHLEGKGLPVPSVIRSVSGETAVETLFGVMRVLTYLEGLPLHLAPRSAAQTRAMGAMAAQISMGLQGFTHPGADHVLQWDIRQASALRPLLAHVPGALRGLCTTVLNHFDTQIAPQLPGVRWQVVHNDLNPHNVLVDTGDPDRIAGVLDFGDMVRTPLVCDAGVAASYQVDSDKPLESLVDFAAAYHRVLPFQRQELALLADLAAVRMLTTICITSWRAARYPDNASYILRNFAAAEAGLLALSALPRDAVQTALFAACPMEKTDD